MAMRLDQEERTEQPTMQRLADARLRGQVARSSDLSGALVLMGTLTALALLSGSLLDGCVAMLRNCLSGAHEVSSVAAPRAVWMPAGVLAGLGVLALTAVAVAVMAGVLQAGLSASSEPLRPDLGRCSIGDGLRRMFSLRSLVRGLLAIGKVAAVVAVVWLFVRRSIDQVQALAWADALGVARGAGGLAFRLGMQIAFAMLALGVLDYLYQRWQLRQDLKMTRRELIEELRRAGVARLSVGRRIEDARAFRDAGGAAGSQGRSKQDNGEAR